MIATIKVAINTPLAFNSLLVFINRKKAARFRMAPIQTNFVKTPCAIAISKESKIDVPVPNINSASVKPMMLAKRPMIIPIKTSLLFFKFPGI